MDKFSFAVMSGGEGRRFGGDKTKALLNSKELYLYSIEKGLTLSDDVMLISRNSKKYNPFVDNVRYIEDEYENQCPMAGMITAANNAKYDNIFILSADMPLISIDVIKLICKNFQNCDAVIPVINEKSYNLTAIYKKSLLKSLINFYKNNIYKLNICFNQFNITFLDEKYFSKYNIQKEFLNINTTSQLDIAENFLK